MEHVTEGSWETLQVPLHPRVLGALRELGFPHMTPVQVSGSGEARLSAQPLARMQLGDQGAPIGAAPRVFTMPTPESQLRACPARSSDFGQWLSLCPFRLRSDNHFLHSIMGIK